MELNQDLQTALIEREVATRMEAQIKSDLSRLPQSARKGVAMRVLVNVLAGLDAEAKADANWTPIANGTPRAPETVPVTGIPVAGNGYWQKVLAYCQANPTPGKYHYVEVAEAVFPEKMSENREVFLSTLSTVLRRRCVNKRNSKDPYFRWLKDGRFRLLTTDERAKALEKKALEKKALEGAKKG